MHEMAWASLSRTDGCKGDDAPCRALPSTRCPTSARAQSPAPFCRSLQCMVGQASSICKSQSSGVRQPEDSKSGSNGGTVASNASLKQPRLQYRPQICLKCVYAPVWGFALDQLAVEC